MIDDRDLATISAHSRWEEDEMDAEEFASASLLGVQRCTKEGALSGVRE